MNEDEFVKQIQDLQKRMAELQQKVKAAAIKQVTGSEASGGTGEDRATC